MVKNRKYCLKNIKGRMALIMAGLSTGILMMSGCNKDTSGSVDDKSEVVLSEVPSEEVSEIQSEEVSEEVSEVIAEENPYQHIPEDLLDENGKYHPAEVTADMLRERFADVDKFVADNGYIEDYASQVKASIMRANYSFMSDDTFIELVNEYQIPINNFDLKMYYDGEPEYAPENYYFDPYLQYTARTIYDLCYKYVNEFDNGDKDLADEYYNERTKAIKTNGILPINMNGSNIYEKTDFRNSTATYEMISLNGATECFDGFLISDYGSLFANMLDNPKIKIK